MRFQRGDVVLFKHDPDEPATYDRSKHTGLVMDVYDELGDDLNEHTLTIVWSTAGTIGGVQEMALSTARKFLEIVKTNHQEL